MKEKIEKWYTHHLWSLDMVKQAVNKKVITPEEFKEITGLDYEE